MMSRNTLSKSYFYEAPLISVVMSVYNGENDLKQSVPSILNQTFTDFEFVIVNDGSSDSTLNIIKDYQKNDQRIVIIDQHNKGLTKSLNIGIAKSRGKYIARQDTDDESLPTRFAEQVAFLEDNPDVVVLGTTAYQVMDEITRIGSYFDDDTLKELVYLRNPFPHTSVVFRKDIFIRVGMYDESYILSQDFECWMRMMSHGRISMLNVPLVKQNKTENSISRKRKFLQIYNGARARLKNPEKGLLRAFQSILYQIVTAYMPRRLVILKRRILNK
jgi:glycosyltransferase involved in cell wall biosynthesis